MTRDRSIDLFSIAGVRIAIDYSWIVIFLLVLWSLSAGYFPHEHPGFGWRRYWSVGAIGTLLFFCSVLIHELAHAVVANRLGQQVRRITLFIFGGMAHLSREPSDATAEMKIAVVGPLTSLALGAGFWILKVLVESVAAAPLWVTMLTYLSFVNVALALFNLLPGFPLDGGRLLRGYLWRRSRDLRAATARAADWGRGIAFALMALGLLEIFSGAIIGGLWLIFIGMFLRGAAQASYQGMVIDHVLRRVRVRDLMIRDVVVVPGEQTVEEAIEEQFLRHGYSGFPVGDGGHVEGLVSLAQIKHCPPAERMARTVRDIMRPADAGLTIAANASVADALRQMAEVGSGRLLVIEAGLVTGLITRSAIARLVQVKTELAEAAE